MCPSQKYIELNDDVFFGCLCRQGWFGYSFHRYPESTNCELSRLAPLSVQEKKTTHSKSVSGYHFKIFGSPSQFLFSSETDYPFKRNAKALIFTFQLTLHPQIAWHSDLAAIGQSNAGSGAQMPSILSSYQLGPMSNVLGDYIHIIHISSKARSSPVDSAIQLKNMVQPMEKPSRLSVRKVRSLQHFYQAMTHIPAHLLVQLLPTPHWRWHQCTRSILPLGPLNSWAEARRQVRLLETFSVFHDLPTPQPVAQNPSISCSPVSDPPCGCQSIGQ